MTPRKQGPCPSPTPQGTLCFGRLSSKCVNVPSGTEDWPGPALPCWWRMALETKIWAQTWIHVGPSPWPSSGTLSEWLLHTWYQPHAPKSSWTRIYGVFSGALGLSPIPEGQSSRKVIRGSWYNTFFTRSWERLGCQNGANMLIVGDLNCLEVRGHTDIRQTAKHIYKSIYIDRW